jgi:hypothetical protein
MSKKYVLYLNIEDKLELTGETYTTSSHFTSTESFYKNMMRDKVRRELLDEGDKLLILSTKDETYITRIE